MSLEWWVVWYGVDVVFWWWIIRGGGAEWCEGRLRSAFLVDYFAIKWSADGIKLFGWLMLIGSTAGFLIGLFAPAAREILRAIF